MEAWEALVEHAAQLCAANDIPVTKLRLAVLRQLWEMRGSAIGAYDLAAMVMRSEFGQVAPSSVYRVVSAFQKLGLVRRIESRQAYLLTDGVSEAGFDIFLLCECCDNIATAHDATLENILAQKVDVQGFTLATRIVEISGVCRLCRNKAV